MLFGLPARLCPRWGVRPLSKNRTSAACCAPPPPADAPAGSPARGWSLETARAPAALAVLSHHAVLAHPPCGRTRGCRSAVAAAAERKRP